MLTRIDVSNLLPKENVEYDVVVAGGGPAGIAAAVASASLGAKTLILEGDSFFGGIAAAAMWMPVNRIMFNGVTPEGGNRGGVHDLFVKAIKDLGTDAYSEKRHPVTDIRGGLSIHPDYLRIAAFHLLEDVKCDYCLYSPVTGVIMDGNKITGVQVTGKSGLRKIACKVVIDATGDGDVSYYSGVEMLKGREPDGLFMPSALLFALSNVDIVRFFDFQVNQKELFKSIFEKAAEDGYCTSKWYGFDEASIPGVVNVNSGGPIAAGNIDATNEDELTIAERLGIQMAMDFVKIARERIPGMENCMLMRVGAKVAVRDSRRIVGEYAITVDDACNGTEFEDIVSRRYGFIDAVGYYIGPMKSGHAYPYRCLLPIGVESLLVAGRCSSATHLGFASGRGMGEMMGMGQAAGVAAAICSRKGILPRHVNVKEVQDVIRGMGVIL